MKKRLNFKLVVWLLAIGAAIGVGGHFLHGFQVQRNAASLLHLAEEAESKNEPERAVKYYRLYLRHDRSDTNAIAHFGALLVKLAKTGQQRLAAVEILDQVLRRQPERHDMRRLLIGQAMHPQLQRFSDAKDHLVFLCPFFPNEAELQLKLGLCEEALGKLPEAETRYAAAIKLAPTLLDGYRNLADLQGRKFKKPADAVKTLNLMVAQNPGQAKAWLYRAQHRRLLGSIEPREAMRQEMFTQAAADLVQAAQLGEQDAEILLESAELALARDNIEQARSFLKRGLETHVKDVRFHLAGARLEARAERRDSAMAFLKRGLEHGPGNQDLLWAIALMSIDEKNWVEAESIQKKLRIGGLPAPLLDFLKGHVLVQKGEWSEAARLLETVRPHLTPWTGTAIQADLLLARCHGQLGDLEKRELDYRRALGIDPVLEAASLGLGESLLAQGQYEKAFAALSAASYSSRARFRAAHALILHNLRQVPGQRRWPEVERFLDEIAQSSPGAPELAVLRAAVLAGKNELVQASDTLTAAMENHPQNVSLINAYAELLERQEKWQEALTLFDDAEKKIGSSIELSLARVRYWVARGGSEATAALTAIDGFVVSHDDKDTERLTQGLADAWLALGHKKEAARLYARFAQKDLTNLGVRILLFDLAMDQDQDEEAQRRLAEISRIEGPDGTLWRFGKACRLLRQARAAKQAPADEVRELLTAIAARRPKWSRLILAEAEWEELSGRPESAIRKYQQAIDAGERDPIALRRAVVLLYERRRFLEADQLLQKMQQPAGTLMAGLDRVAAELALFKKDATGAVQFARQAVAEDSKDYRDLLWLGHVLCAAEMWSDAEVAFRRAVEFGEQAPETWVTLVWFLARTDRKESAQTLLETARLKLPAGQAPLALAQGYEALQQLDKASQFYEAARKAKPDDVDVLRNVARFALSVRRLDEAERHLRNILTSKTKSPEDAAWAKRFLAIVLLADGDYKKTREALTVLGIRDEAELVELTADSTSDEQRLKAVVLAVQKNRAQRRQAIALLEPLVRKEGRADDRFLLAQLYQSVGEARPTDEQIASLLAQYPDQVGYLTFHIRNLLVRKRLDEVEPYLTRLEKIQPGTMDTVRLHASFLNARGTPEQAVPLLRALAESKPDQSVPAAILMEELGQVAAAEEVYRKLAAKMERPEFSLLLATFLGRQKRVSEGLEVCADAWQTCSPLAVANASLNVLVAGQASPEECGQVAEQLEKAREKSPNSNPLLASLAIVRRLEGKIPDSIALYKELLSRDPNDAMAMNNLAWLLTICDGKGEEGLELIQQAIKLAGPESLLLDTRGMIHLSLGQTTPAIRDLEAAVADGPSASRFFHLAQAYLRAGQRNVAIVTWQRALAEGLQTTNIDPLEMPVYEKLAQDLAP